MAKILLGVTGSVAAIKTPDLYRLLIDSQHQVKIVATTASTYFFDPTAIRSVDQGSLNIENGVVYLDADEWPRRVDGSRYHKGDPVTHIELRRWADLFLIAPLDANTLGKIALGLADNCLTCVWRAWDTARPAVLAPAMNTMMWQHPATLRHLRQIALDTAAEPPNGLTLEVLLDWMNQNCPRLRIATPENRPLACGDVGIGAMASLDRLVSLVSSLIELGSK